MDWDDEPTRSGSHEEDGGAGRPTGPGAECWCGCGELIPDEMRSTARFIASHKDGHHNRQRSSRNSLSSSRGATLSRELAAAVAEARRAQGRLGKLASVLVERIEEIEHRATEADERALRAGRERDAARAELNRLHRDEALPAKGGEPVVEVDRPAQVLAAPLRQGSPEKEVRSALMVAVRAERARAVAAEAQVAALAADVGRIADWVLACRSGPTSRDGCTCPPAPGADGSDRPADGSSVPYSVICPGRLSVTVPVTAGAEGGTADRTPFGSLARLDDDGPLTIDEAGELLTATAMGIVEEVGNGPDLAGVLDGSLAPCGLSAGAAGAVETHRRTLARLADQGLGHLAPGILDGALAYASDCDGP